MGGILFKGQLGEKGNMRLNATESFPLYLMFLFSCEEEPHSKEAKDSVRGFFEKAFAELLDQVFSKYEAVKFDFNKTPEENYKILRNYLEKEKANA